MEYEMSKIDQSVLSEFINSVANLEVLYPFNEEGALPPTEYTSLLTSSLFMNDASSLMKVLDTEDINPWGVYFVEDGLGEGSPDKQSMIVFAARKKSWACVSALVEHYQDCHKSIEIMAAVEPSLAEYEVATDPNRIEFLESFMRAANSGYAKNLEKMGFHVVFQPNYVSDYPKANRFMFKSFAVIDFSKKKLASPSMLGLPVVGGPDPELCSSGFWAPVVGEIQKVRQIGWQVVGSGA
jgi:hypothetical protein